MRTRALSTILVAGALCGFSVQAASGQDIDSMPPVVVKTVPEAGAANVPPGEYEVKVTFSKEMQDHSWTWSTTWKDSTPEVIGGPRYEADHKTCVLKVKLEADTAYGYWLNSQNFHGFKDAQGHAAVPYLLVFKTGKKAAAQEPASAPAASKTTTDQVIVEDLALEMLVAVRDKDDEGMQTPRSGLAYRMVRTGMIMDRTFPQFRKWHKSALRDNWERLGWPPSRLADNYRPEQFGPKWSEN